MANMAWSPAVTGRSRSVQGVCATGTDTLQGLVTDGMALDHVEGFILFAAADAGQTITSGSLKAYLLNAVTGRWARCPDLDAVVAEAGNRDLAFVYPSPGPAIPVVSRGSRIAYVPNLVLSAGGVTIYLLATNTEGDTV